MFIAGLLIMIRPVIRKLPYNRIEALLFTAGADFPPFVFTITPFIAQQVVCVCIDVSQPREGGGRSAKIQERSHRPIVVLNATVYALFSIHRWHY